MQAALGAICSGVVAVLLPCDRAYDRTLASPDLQALRMAKSPCDCGSGLKSADCCHG